VQTEVTGWKLKMHAMREALVALLFFEAATAFLFASPLGVSIYQRRSVLLQPRRSDGCTRAEEAAGDVPPHALRIVGEPAVAASALMVASGRCNSQFVSICVAATERRRGLDSRGAPSQWRRAVFGGRTYLHNTGTPEGAGIPKS
jgi:hypothetical protein